MIKISDLKKQSDEIPPGAEQQHTYDTCIPFDRSALQLTGPKRWFNTAINTLIFSGGADNSCNPGFSLNQSINVQVYVRVKIIAKKTPGISG